MVPVGTAARNPSDARTWQPQQQNHQKQGRDVRHSVASATRLHVSAWPINAAQPHSTPLL